MNNNDIKDKMKNVAKVSDGKQRTTWSNAFKNKMEGKEGTVCESKM